MPLVVAIKEVLEDDLLLCEEEEHDDDELQDEDVAKADVNKEEVRVRALTTILEAPRVSERNVDHGLLEI